MVQGRREVQGLLDYPGCQGDPEDQVHPEDPEDQAHQGCRSCPGVLGDRVRQEDPDRRLTQIRELKKAGL